MYKGGFQDLDSNMECIGYRRRNVLDAPSTFETSVTGTSAPDTTALPDLKDAAKKPKPLSSYWTINTVLAHTIGYCGLSGQPCEGHAIVAPHDPASKRQYQPTTLATYGLPGATPFIADLPAISTLATPDPGAFKRFNPVVASAAAFLDTPPAIPYFTPGRPVMETGLDDRDAAISEPDASRPNGAGIDCIIEGSGDYCGSENGGEPRSPAGQMEIIARGAPPFKHPESASSADWPMTPMSKQPSDGPTSDWRSIPAWATQTPHLLHHPPGRVPKADGTRCHGEIGKFVC